MRNVLVFSAVLPLLLAASGCTQIGMFKDGTGEAAATPGTGIYAPTPGADQRDQQKTARFASAANPVAVAVYGYGDQTGQAKPLPANQPATSMSRAVTQGAASILIKTLQDAGNGRWFTVIERERLDNLLKERRIIADMRMRYLGEQGVNPAALPPLLFAGVLIDGGIIGYDSNTRTGGAGANYFGLGGNATYSEDTVTVYLRGTSVKTGQVLLSVTASKKILSYGLDANFYRYVTYNRLFQAEIGFTRNEPGSLAVQQAIEQAVLQFVVEGTARGLWEFKDKGFQNRIVQEYEMTYLTEARPPATPANGGGEGTAAAANGQQKSPEGSAKPASAPAKPAGASAKTAASGWQAKPVQQASLAASPAPGQQQATPQPAPPVGQTQSAPQPGPQFAFVAGRPLGVPQPAPPAGQPQQQPPPQFVVLPRTLEDEVPISPR